MKMRDVANVIESNMNLEYSADGRYQVDSTFKKNIKELTELPCFSDFDDLYNFFINTDAFIFGKSDYNNSIFSRVFALKSLCSLYLKNFHSFYPKINENSISFKFKETNDLESIANTMLSLNKALNQMFSGTYINSSYQLSNFDQGSKWIDIILEKKLAFTCLAAALTFVTETVINIQEIRLKEADIDNIKVEIQEKLKNIELKDLEIKKFKEDLEILELKSKHSEELDILLREKKIENKVTELIDNYYNSTDDKELPNRLKHAIKELIKLQIDENTFRPTDLITYNIPDNNLNPWGYIEEAEKKKIDYKKEETNDK